MAESTPDPRRVPLIWVGIEDVEITFTNQMLIQNVGAEFVISFGQIAPPAILGSEEEQREAMRSVEWVPVKPVVRVGISSERMGDFVRAMQENLQRYETTKEGIES